VPPSGLTTSSPSYGTKLQKRKPTQLVNNQSKPRNC
jgi:hypothetical protein